MKPQNLKSVFSKFLIACVVTCFAIQVQAKSIDYHSTVDTTKMDHKKMSKMSHKKGKKMDKMHEDKMSGDHTTKM